MRSLLALLSALSIAVVIAACGGDDAGTSSAAELVPAGSTIYAEFTLEPDGDQQAAIEAIVSKFPGGEGATGRIRELIEQGLRESDAPITFKDDIEPWLGETGAFFLGAIPTGSADPDGALLLASEDDEAASDALDKAFEKDSKKEDYNDVELLVDSGNDAAAAVTDGWVLIGTVRGVKRAIDATGDGQPLEESERYANAVDGAAEERLGLVYVDTKRIFESVQGASTAIPPTFRSIFDEPSVTTVDVAEDGVEFETSIPDSLAQAFPLFGKGSDLVNELPADSWLAMAQPDFGKLADTYIEAFGAAAGGREVIEQQFEAASGLELGPDVLDWMGDFAVFVRGSDVPNLNGALVVETTDPDATERFIDRIRALGSAQSDPGTRIVPLAAAVDGEGFTVSSLDVPQQIHVFLSGDRFVVAYGDAAAKDAVDPAQTLGESPEFQAATESLQGYDISFYVGLAPIFQLVDSTPAADDQGYQAAKPYLAPLQALVAGTSGDGEDRRTAFKIVVD